MNYDKKITIGLTCIPIILLIVFAWAILPEFDKDEIDIMDPANMCRPVKDNYQICGVDSSKEFVIISLANGMKFKTDCNSDNYPYGINGTHFKCNETSKTYDKFERVN